VALRTREALPAQSRAGHLAALLPMLAVAVVLLTAATDFFPDTTLIGVITPLRLVTAGGVVALVCTGARLSTLRTRIDIPIGVLVLVSAAGTILHGWPGAPLRQLLVDVAVFYLVVGLRRTRPESRTTLSMLALVSVSIAGTVAFAQISDQTPTGFCGGGFLGDVTCSQGAMIRAEGTFSNPNELAAFLLLLAPTAVLARTVVTDRLTQIVLVGLAVIGAGAVLTTFSRGAYAGMVVGLGAAVAARTLLRRLSRLQLTLLVTAGTLALAGSAMLIAILSRHDESLGLRGRAWTAAMRAALKHPLLGVGLGRAGSVISSSTGAQFAHAHNMWLNWLVETGVLGLLAITAITVIAVVSAARLASQGSATGAAELAGLTGFLLMSLLDDPANSSRIAVAMWLMTGLVMAEMPAGWRHAAAPVSAESLADAPAAAEKVSEKVSAVREPEPEAAVVTQPMPAVAGPPTTSGKHRRPPPDSLGETLPTPAVPPRTRAPAAKRPMIPGRPAPGRARTPAQRNNRRYPPPR
jgi:O-antigen ligase